MAKLDEVIAAGKKTKENKVYRVTIGGDYFAPGANGNVLLPYEVTILVSDKLIEKTGVLGTFVQSIGPTLMPRLFPGFIAFYTHVVIRSEALDGADITNLELFNREELVEIATLEELPITTELFEDAGSLRTAIKDCRKDTEAFLKQQHTLAKYRLEAIQTRNEALALNKDIIASASAVQTVDQALATKHEANEKARSSKGKAKDPLADM